MDDALDYIDLFLEAFEVPVAFFLADGSLKGSNSLFKKFAKRVNLNLKLGEEKNAEFLLNKFQKSESSREKLSLSLKKTRLYNFLNIDGRLHEFRRIKIADGKEELGTVWIFKDESHKAAIENEVLALLDKKNDLIAQIAENQQRLKLLKKELDAANEKARASARAKEAFFAGVGHEFRTPLNIIAGYSEIIKESDADEEIKRFAGSIFKAAKDLSEKIGETIEFANLISASSNANKRIFDGQKFCQYIIARLNEKAKLFNLAIKIEKRGKIEGKILADDLALQKLIDIAIDKYARSKSEGKIKVYIFSDLTSDNKIDLTLKFQNFPKQYKKVLDRIVLENGSEKLKIENDDKLFDAGLLIVKHFAEINDGSVSYDFKNSGALNLLINLKCSVVRRI